MGLSDPGPTEDLSSGEDGHDDHTVLIANEAVQTTHVLVDQNNDMGFST